jgi:hypothetical protein
MNREVATDLLVCNRIDGDVGWQTRSNKPRNERVAV